MGDSDRKNRRKANIDKTNKRSSKKKQFITMVISIAITTFIVVQTVYLFRYTLGYEVAPSKLKVYSWIKALINNEQIIDEKDNI